MWRNDVVRVSIVAMVIAASLAAPAPAHSQVSVQVNIGQPPPVLVAQPVLVPVQASPVYYAQHGADVFFYDGRYYTVHNDQWFYATRVNTPWVSVAIGKVPRAVLAVPRAAGPRPGSTLPAGTGQERSLLKREATAAVAPASQRSR
jgi:hypothetical protein